VPPTNTIATRLRTGRPEVRLPKEARNFCLIQNVQNGWKNREEKRKLSCPCARHENYGTGGIDPVMNIGLSWVWLVSFMHQPLYPQGKDCVYPLNRRFDGPQGCFGRGKRQKKEKSWVNVLVSGEFTAACAGATVECNDFQIAV